MPSPHCTALITGFGPFPGVPHNVSATIAERIGVAVGKRFPSCRIVTAALPTEWDVAPERAAELICELRPSIALHLGVSDHARGFVIETIARNQTGRVDAAGLFPLACELDPFGPDELATQLPAGRIDARLKRRALPCRLSRDAGTYLCNAVFYRSVLTQLELGGGGRSGFVHIPVAVGGTPRRFGHTPAKVRGKAPVMDIETAVRGGIEIVAACLNR